MTQKKRIFILLLVLIGSFGSIQSYAGRNGKTHKTKTHRIQSAPVASPKADDGDYYNGHKIYVGPRGGRYYINGNGNKTYISH